MPLQDCQKDGQKGFRWGSSGTCYPHDGTAAGIAAAKKRAIRQAIAIGGGKMPNASKHAELSGEDVLLVLEAAAEFAAASDELPTVSMPRVPILSEGGPYFGTGSPKEGDYYTKADLEKIGKANRELADQVKPPNKLGHSDKQKLLANSGLSADEMPAIGWLDGSTFRVEQDAKFKKWTLYADAVKVPAKIAKLLKSGGYRTRSVELSKVRDGKKTWPLVVTALAWLGAKAPAVRTLDDVFAMYAEGDIVWKGDDGFKNLMDDLRAQLAPPAGQPCRYWIDDISTDLSRCIVRDWEQNKVWVAAVTVAADGEATIAPQNEWTLAEQAWVEANVASGYATAARDEYEQAVRKNGRGAADTEGMPDKTKLTDEQIVGLAKALGIDAEATEYSDELRTKVSEHLRGLEETQPPGGGGGEGGSGGTGTEGDGGEGGNGEGGTAGVAMSQDELKALQADAELGRKAYQERIKERHDTILAKALGRDGDTHRIDPADEPGWRKFLEANEERALEALKLLPEIENSRVFGSDDIHLQLPEGETVEDVAKTGAQAWRDYAGATGVPVRENAS